MNQICKVCGEPAAGFHFGAFTCEGCKSFFGRSYNNIGSITECKNQNKCVINKKNRTACKACRLKKCLMVGMSKSGSRYGRRSNWFKIHCLLQEQQQHHQQQQQHQQAANSLPQKIPSPHHPPLGLGLLGPPSFATSLIPLPKTKEELRLLGLDEYKHSASPSVSSPESHNSDSSVEVGDARRLPIFAQMLQPAFLQHPGFLFPQPYPHIYSGLLQPANNNNRYIPNNNTGVESFSKRVYLDRVLKQQRSPTPEEIEPVEPVVPLIQDNPIDLSMKTMSERSSPTQSERSGSLQTERDAGSDIDELSDSDSDKELKRTNKSKPSPLDLSTKQ